MLQSKNLTRVLSLLIAIVLWAYVIAFENPPVTERITGVPVRLFNEEMLTKEGLAVLEGHNVTVDVTVSGTRSDISRYKDQIIATANVFGYKIGMHYVTVDVLPPGPLKLVEIRPVKILVNIESLVSAHFPVQIAFTGEAEPDTEPGNIAFQPEQIEISGPESLIESISYVSVEIPNAQLMREPTSITVPATPIDVNGAQVSRVKLSSETVSVRATMYDVKEVPLHVEITGVVDERFEMTQCLVPNTIMIRGSRQALLEIGSVEAETIDISGVEITSELLITPLLPDGVEIASGSHNIHVSIGIKGISNKSFEYESRDIEILGTGEGLKGYINTPVINIKIAGREAVLEAATKKDIILSVDIEGLEEGSHVVPITATYEIVLNNLELIPVEVYITISEDINQPDEEEV